MRAVRYYDDGTVHEGLLTDAGELRAERAPTGAPRLEGLITGRFTDHHVHLQLIDHTLLAASRIGRVLDLGAELEWVRAAAVHNSSETSPFVADRSENGVSAADSEELRTVIAYAGPFLTSPGGYPSDRSWAPAGSVREISTPGEAAAAVADLAAAGASAVKVVAHSEAGPVLDDDLVHAIVHAADEHGLLVIAHAEGAGQAQRMVRLGADRLAHAPFTETLTDAEIADQAAHITWISTLAVHDDTQRAVAIDNVRRFVASGGHLLYGTDMGNGDTPVDLRMSELAALSEAGLDSAALLAALTPLSPFTGGPLLLLPDDDPAHARPLHTLEA